MILSGFKYLLGGKSVELVGSTMAASVISTELSVHSLSLCMKPLTKAAYPSDTKPS
jgi:hypothetical protein